MMWPLLTGSLRNDEAWESFLAGIQGEEEKPETEPDTPVLEEPRVQAPQVEESLTPRPNRYRRVAWMAAVPFVLAVVTWGIWKTVSKPAPVAVASIERMTYPLPDKPSIAVLPFDNLSGDPQQEFFSDGLTEEIITTLSKSPYLFVIARHSSFIYKGKSDNRQAGCGGTGRPLRAGGKRAAFRRKSPNYGPTRRRVTGTSSLG